MLTMKRVVGPLTLAAATLLVAAAGAGAATTSDQPAAIVIYPKVVYDTAPVSDTIIEIANTSTSPIDLHCFYVNATSHCTNTGAPCDTGLDCGGVGACVPGWAEIDFSVTLTRNQPFYWLAGTGRNRSCAAASTCEPLPLNGTGVCAQGILAGQPCTNAAQCGVGPCVGADQSNAGTAVPPVPESLFFIGELKCVAVNSDGTPSGRNDLIGTATIVTDLGDGLIDAQSYNAIGVQANSRCDGDTALVCSSDDDCGADGPCVSAVDSNNILVLGPNDDPEAEYQYCPETLVLDHIFDGAPDPVGEGIWMTDLTLVPCSENFALGQADLGRSTAQFLVYNEFEQRFSTSRPVTCFDETLLSNIDTRNNARSIFSVNVSGTIAGQSLIRPVGDGLIGVARAMKVVNGQTIEDISAQVNGDGLRPVFAPGVGYEIHQLGERQPQDRIVIP